MIYDINTGRKNQLGVDIVILGTGYQWLEDQFATLASRVFDSSIVYVREYNDSLARLIYAASDMILVPSDYEPSGITQMLAMRYGAVPLVRMTGGLADTVSELGPKQTGFLKKVSAELLLRST